MPSVGRGQLTLTDLNDVLASATPPTNPPEGALWWDTTRSKLFVYSSGKWEISANYEDYVRSRGENLVTNGTGLLGSNINFSQFTFDGSQVYAGGGSFYTNNQNTTKFNDELIPVDVSRKYKFSLMAKSLTGLGRNYFGVVSYDIDGNTIQPPMYYGSVKPVTTLAQDLKVGDTKIYLTSSTGFVDTNFADSGGHLHSIVLWGYKNSYGYEYPVGTYSRLVFNSGWNNGAIDRTNHVITLNKPFDVANPNDPQGIFRTGHNVSPTQSGGSYQYMTGSNVLVSKTDWTKFEGIITGNGTESNAFPFGTSFVKLLFLLNRSSSGGQAGDAMWLNSLSFSDITDVKDLGDSVTDIQTTLGNMANDNIVELQERKVIKEKLTDILGLVIADTTTSMPTTATLDASLKGGFYSVRKSALNAGLLTTDAVYINVATRYNELKSYLDGLTPVKPWDIRDQTAVISVTKTTFRDRWLNYFTAVDALATATAQKLKQNVDDVSIGGTNFASNGDFSQTLADSPWSASYVGQTRNIVDISSQKPPFRFAYYVKNTTNANGGILSPVLFTGGVAEALVGKDLTISFWLKYANIVQGTNTYNNGRFGELVIKGQKSDGTFAYSYPNSLSVTGSNGDWMQYSKTIKLELPAGTTKIVEISFKHVMEGCTGEFWTTGIKVEGGNKATDWSPNPMDMQGRVTNVEQKVTPDAIVSTVTSSSKYTQDLGGIQSKVDEISGRMKVRYIRDYLNGSTANTTNHWVQIMAMAGTTNRALNKTVTASKTTNNLTRITNGTITSTDFADSTAGLAWVRVDLGAVYDDIDILKVWHYYSDGRTYNATKTEVSEDGNTWTTVYDSAIDGLYKETAEGNIININGDISKNLRDVGKNITLIQNKVEGVEQAITAEGITTVIKSSTFYENYVQDLEAKADASAVGNMIPRDEFDDFAIAVDDKVTSAIGNIDFSPYATQQDVEETATNLTRKFSASGGMNLLRNSIGFSELITEAQYDNDPTLKNWFVTASGAGMNRLKRIQTTALDTLGFGSGFQMNRATTSDSSVLNQYVNVVPDQLYTLSWYINKDNQDTGSGYVWIEAYEDGSGTNKVKMLDPNSVAEDPFTLTTFSHNSDFVTDGFQAFSVVMKPTTSKIRIRVFGAGLAQFQITGLMFTIGDVPLQWSLATGENYNTNVRFDINGIRISQLDASKTEIGYTQITPDEFAGYWSPDGGTTFDKVFYLNGEETVTKKLKAIDEITMGSIKIIKIEASAYKGWAFVPITEE
jgi:hypothetical protein